MKFTTNVGTLKTTLANMSKVVKPSKAVSILGYVRVHAENDKVFVSGTDHKVFYKVALENTTDVKDVDLMLNLAETHTMLIKLGSADEVTFEYDEDDARLRINSGKSTWMRDLRSGVDFPKFPELSQDMWQEISSAGLYEALTAALRATPKSTTFTPGLTQIKLDDGWFESGDGMWFQRVRCEDLNHVSTTIPNVSAKALLAVVRGWKDKTVSVGNTAHHTVLRTESEVLGVARCAVDFPDLEHYLDGPKITHQETLTTNIKEFTSVLEQVSLSAPKDTGLITLDLGQQNNFRVSAKTPEGEAESYCAGVWDGKPRKVNTDWRALVGVMKELDTELVSIKFGPDTMRHPSTLFINNPNMVATLSQMRVRA